MIKKGFTLAEVLITLGVIGVVAAMTLPTLIQNYQKHVWVNQLKKSYSTLNQGFQKILADEEVSLLNQTEMFSKINGTCDYTTSLTSSQCKNFYEKFRKYFKVTTIKRITSSDKYPYKSLNGATSGYVDSNIVQFSDGACMFWGAFRSQPDLLGRGVMKGRAGNFWLDVNCMKKPNTYGRDIFVFYLGNNGIVYPLGSQATAEYFQLNGWYDIKWETTTNNEYKCVVGGTYQGKACASRVLEEGKMNY